MISESQLDLLAEISELRANYAELQDDFFCATNRIQELEAEVERLKGELLNQSSSRLLMSNLRAAIDSVLR